MRTLPFMPPTTLPPDVLNRAGPATIGRIIRIALDEWHRFGHQVVIGDDIIHEGGREDRAGYRQRVGLFWRYGTGKRYDGADRDQAWSAAFISYVMRSAGVADHLFPRSIRHSEYIHFAQQNELTADPDAAFVAHRLLSYVPKPGDLVAYTRGSNLSYDRAARRTRYKSHTDIVVYVRAGEIGVIGGNVKHSVSLKRLIAGAGGRLRDQTKDWFAVIENRLPLQ